jgi:6-pyruvoyl-tetrahydropterin synthase
MAQTQHFEIYIQRHFSAAHHLRDYPGDCANPHGHNWLVDIFLECSQLNAIGIGCDFCEIKAVVRITEFKFALHVSTESKIRLTRFLCYRTLTLSI